MKKQKETLKSKIFSPLFSQWGRDIQDMKEFNKKVEEVYNNITKPKCELSFDQEHNIN